MNDYLRTLFFQKMLDYDTVLNMEYLDMVVSEALRLYPPGAM